MKFLVLMAEADSFEKWDALSDADQQEHFAAFTRFSDAVKQRGSVLAGEALEAPGAARTVRPGNGARTVTEGPFAETVEQLGGFWLVDLADRDTAVELARLLPSAYSVEVRPIVDMDE